MSLPCPSRANLKLLEDRWIFSRLSRTAESANRALEQHRYHEVAEELWQFFWHDFCDWYLEIKKLRLSPNSGLTNDWRNLLAVFSAYLRLQHPILPFITEELWHRFGQNTSIALARYPQAGAVDQVAEHEMGLLQDMVTAARKLKADNGLDDKLELAGVLYCRNGSKSVELSVLEWLAKVKLDMRTDPAPVLSGAVRSTPEFDLSLQLPEVDHEVQRQRLAKETDKLGKAGREYRSPARKRKVPEWRASSRGGRVACQTSWVYRSDRKEPRRDRPVLTRPCHRLGVAAIATPDRRIEWHTTIGSTMTEASQLADSGRPFRHPGRRRGTDRRTRPSWAIVAFRARLRVVRLHHFAAPIHSSYLACGYAGARSRGARSDPQDHRSGVRSALAQ